MSSGDRLIAIVFKALLLAVIIGLFGSSQALALCLDQASVTLSWQPNPEPDIYGYEIYRSNYVDGPYSKAHQGLIAGTSWTDYNVSEGPSYYYKLRAVDLCGNVSDFSAPSEEVVIDLTSPTVGASPAGGTYQSSQTVSLSASESCSIHYTLDGSTPTLQSTTYTSPITISQTTTLKYFAVDCAGNQSAIMTSTYIISTGVDEVIITAGPAGEPNPVASGGTVQCGVTAEDTFGHTLTYQWSASGGSFNNSTAQNPIWYAPANTSGSTQVYDISVIITCSEGKWAGGSFVQSVRSLEDEVVITAGPAGTPNPVDSGGTVQCGVTAEDTFGHTLSYQWTASGGSFNNSTAQNPIWHAPVNTSDTIQSYQISVVITCSQGKWAGGSYQQQVSPFANEQPVADAGDEQIVRGSVTVNLNGCNSYDPDGGPSDLTYQWQQTDGANAVTLIGPNTCSPRFTSPNANDTLTFRLTAYDGMATDTDSVTVRVDVDPPQLIPEELGPYPNQGLDGNIGASAFSCMRARLIDNIGIDTSQACDTLITAYAVEENGGEEVFEEITGRMEFIEDGSTPGLLWMMFVPDYETTYTSGLPAGLEVAVVVRACDLAGNSMDTYGYRFMVEDPAPELPAQSYSGDPRPALPGDILSVTLLEGDRTGTWMEYLDTIPVDLYFGSEDAIPENAASNPTSIMLNLQPTMVFSDPVKIFIPLPGEKNLTKYKIFHFEPTVGWKKAAVGDGWLEYRENHETADPPMIELWLKHFTVLGLEEEPTGDGGGGSGGSLSCFIATAAYGSANAEDVVILREFRDRYLLTNLPGRLFVRAYYRCSPPMAEFISGHPNARSAVRLALSPLARACNYALVSPDRSRHIVCIGLLLASALFFGVLSRKRAKRQGGESAGLL